MAFVFETERPNLFNIKSATISIGPGQYLPLTEFIFKNPNTVPFGVSTGRKYLEKFDSNPGPGSYYHDIDKEKNEKVLKNSLKNYISKEDQITISNRGLPKFEPEKGEQERALTRCKENYEILGFSSKVKRFANKKRLSTPGPGTYDDEDYKEAKSIKSKCINDKRIIFALNNERQSIFHVNKNEVASINFNKNVFPEKYKEFRKNQKSRRINRKKELKRRLEKEQQEIKKNNDFKYRVSSIPSKNNKGYMVEESTGRYVRKTNPDAFKIFSGDKDDAVGPGTYELVFPEDWKKKGTYWSKSKWEKDPKKIRPKSSYNVNSINCQIGNFRKKHFDENSKINKEMSNYYKSYTTKQLNYKDPTAHNIETISEVIKKRKMPAFISINNVPGPGFYYDSVLMNGMRKASAKPIVEKKPYNLEDELLSNLFKNKINDKEEGAIYDFKKEQAENFRKKILAKLKKNHIPFLSSSERFNLEPYTIKSKNYRNQYANSANNNKKRLHYMKGLKLRSKPNFETESISRELSNYSSTNNSSSNNIIYLYSRPQSMAGTFYRKDIRFREREIEENSKKYVPGPGSYINPFTCTGKSNSIQINGKYMDIRNCIKYIENNRVVNSRPKTASFESNFNNYINYNKNPGVGSYEPGKIYTVKHDMINKIKQGNRTFNSTKLSDRNAIYQFQKREPNGPGSYSPNRRKNIPQNMNPFNQTSLRFEKGGKNNTKEIYEEIYDNQIKLNAIISTLKPKDNKIHFRTLMNKNLYINNSKINRTSPKLGLILKTSNVGPGTYEYREDRFPWIKHSFNIKYNK